MAIKILQKTVNIELCYELFKSRLYYDTSEKHHVRLQLGEAETASEDVAWTQRDGFWMYMPAPWDESYFGLSDQSPSAWESESILCTFDFNPKQTGAFGRDEYGGIMVLHTGDIPGGPADVNAAFWQNYHGPSVEGGGSAANYAVVAHLGALDVTGQMRVFLDEVARIQQTVRA